MSLTEHPLINNIYINIISNHHNFVELMITQLQDAMIHGGSNLILLGNDLAILHDNQSIIR